MSLKFLQFMEIIVSANTAVNNNNILCVGRLEQMAEEW